MGDTVCYAIKESVVVGVSARHNNHNYYSLRQDIGGFSIKITNVPESCVNAAATKHDTSGG